MALATAKMAVSQEQQDEETLEATFFKSGR
jgi:hypothetical protein